MAGLTGRVLEIGAGDGVKLACYPAGVEEILLIEPDPFLRSAALNAAKTVRARVDVLHGDLTRLPVTDATCDAVVCSLILCCSPRLEETFSEVRRVLRPGGELRFFEHQRPANPIMEMTTRLLTPIWSSVFGGCDPARDTVAALRRSGFILDELTPCSFRRMTHVLGVARPGQPLGAGPGSPGGRAS